MSKFALSPSPTLFSAAFSIGSSVIGFAEPHEGVLVVSDLMSDTDCGVYVVDKSVDWTTQDENTLALGILYYAVGACGAYVGKISRIILDEDENTPVINAMAQVVGPLGQQFTQAQLYALAPDTLDASACYETIELLAKIGIRPEDLDGVALGKVLQASVAVAQKGDVKPVSVRPAVLGRTAQAEAPVITDPPQK